MYKIYEDGPGFLIQDPHSPTNSIAVPNVECILQLRARLEQYLTDARTDGPALATQAGKELTMINTVAARRVAQRKGFDIPNRTILYACKSGNIIGAKKDGGRWILPKWAFIEWLDEYAQERRRRRDAQVEALYANGEGSDLNSDPNSAG